jgi:dethiobiotin synthetase/adenosylmethionine--8-amino-7-oxononanoate aminotransferase
MPLRLPVILIGDHKLGGISLSISAFESLRMRGYDIVAVLLFEGEEYKNHEYLTDYFRRHHAVHLGVIPSPPLMDSGPQAMEHYYQEVSSQKQVAAVVTLLREYHDNRIRRLREMAVISCEKIWFPFTQHGTLLSEDVTVIDSAYEDHFQTLATQSNPALQAQGVLRPTFDGSASWWTQGLGHGNPKLALAAAYAASRYGHVTFAQAVHDPALTLAEMLLDGLQNPRLTRVFFSDNGSTGVEVAVKMALRATCNRYGWGTSKDVEVLGLRGSYHGDTIGAMDCSEPNTFNEKVEWYCGRGLWLEYPTVQCANGQWVVELPPTMAPGGTKSIEFRSLSEIFNVKRRKGQLQELYARYILDTLGHSNNLTRKFGALLLEPIVLGAGGMVLV